MKFIRALSLTAAILPPLLSALVLLAPDQSASPAKPQVILFSTEPSAGYQRPYVWQTLPDATPFPPDNPPNAAKSALGEHLFNDRNLSVNGTVSCASCHQLTTFAGADGLAVSEGVDNQTGDRNAPTVWNTGFQRRFLWDGSATSLEQQALQPLLNPIEMGMTSSEHVVERVRADLRYAPRFQQAFGDPSITIERIIQAIASFERSLVTTDSAYDDYVRGDSSALTEQQLYGMALFESVGCVLCHGGPNFSAASVFENGPSRRLFPVTPSPLTAQYSLHSEQGDPFPWRVPSLRNVALTGPWFHNGAVSDLSEVVRIMAEVQLGRGRSRQFHWNDNNLAVIENPLLTEPEIAAIVAFLESLSSKRLLGAIWEPLPPVQKDFSNAHTNQPQKAQP